MFLVGCVLVGIAFVGFTALASRIFLDIKKRREERHLRNY